MIWKWYQKVFPEDLARVAIQLEHARIQRKDVFRRGVGRAGDGATGNRLHIGGQVLTICRWAQPQQRDTGHSGTRVVQERMDSHDLPLRNVRSLLANHELYNVRM